MRQSGQQHSEVMTQLVDVGSGGYMDAKQNKWFELEDVQTIMVAGKNIDSSTYMGVRLRLHDILRNDPICEPFLNAKICVPR